MNAQQVKALHHTEKMSEKIPIDFNADKKAEVKELAVLMGIAGVYGDFPKALKFGITLALSAIKNPQKVYADLPEPGLKIYFQAIGNAETNARKLQEIQKLQKEVTKV